MTRGNGGTMKAKIFAVAFLVICGLRVFAADVIQNVTNYTATALSNTNLATAVVVPARTATTRQWVRILNNGDKPVWIFPGTCLPTNQNTSIYLAPSNTWELLAGSIYNGPISAFSWNNTNQTVNILEGWRQ